MFLFNLDFGFTDFIKKRVSKFLLNRYMGQFFEEKLNVQQICVDLYNGKGSVSNVKLCCEVIWHQKVLSKKIFFILTKGGKKS